MIQYFPKSYERFGANIKVELDLSSNYATTLDLKVAKALIHLRWDQNQIWLA